MNVLYLADVFSGCTWYRCVIPGHAFTLAGDDARVRIMGFTKDDLEWADVLVCQRLWDDAALAAIRWMNAYGKMTVYDLDDDLWSIGPENSASDFWEDHKHQAVVLMRECQRCTTTGEPLAEVMRRFHKDVRVVPNALGDDWQHSGATHDGLVIGWAGSTSHSEDMRAIAPTLYDVLDARPHVTLEIAGGDWLTHPQVRQIEPIAVEKYATLVSRFDIGIAPLLDNRFNRCKSDLKHIEYAGCGIPSVCAKVAPYADTVKHGVTGYLAASDKDWRRYLLRLIDDAQERRAMGQAAYEWVQSRRIGVTLPRWRDALSQAPPHARNMR